MRVLHVLGTLDMGGAESRIMDLYRHMDRNRVQFDFLVHYGPLHGDRAEDCSSRTLEKLRPAQFFDEEVRSLGGEIHVLPRFTGSNYLTYRRAVNDFFRTYPVWPVVEGHMTSTASIYLPAAKSRGSVTIAHARSAGVDRGMKGRVTRFLRRNLAHRCDYMYACSEAAGIAVFGKKAQESGRVIFVPNAIDTDAFAFDEDVRRQIRDQYHIPENAFVIGHVGRFDPVKNHVFLIRTFTDLVRQHSDQDFRLMLVGGGSLMEQCRQQLEQAGLAGKAVFTGKCDPQTTARMYQTFDMFAFPSLYEGLPGTVIEALSSGLTCLISDTITREVCVTDQVRQMPISEGSEEAWAQAVYEISCRKNLQERPGQSQKALLALRDAGYDVKTAAKVMAERYEKLAADAAAGGN